MTHNPRLVKHTRHLGGAQMTMNANICFRGANDWGAYGRGANGRPATVTLWAQMAGAHMAGAHVSNFRMFSC